MTRCWLARWLSLSCYDNAPMESFWGTLKNELVRHCHFKTRQEASRDQMRRHSVNHTYPVSL
ncbi:MAG: hypothetical protein CVU68_00605 [Deltaproteobacteria bacterium HGW-Deltaproteobacteria-3]|nr:MAG: hypothetical protein CVU68_00605 [Deltaproteobacteria bacterium HGW-Deltaproteobacteria-3]